MVAKQDLENVARASQAFMDDGDVAALQQAERADDGPRLEPKPDGGQGSDGSLVDERRERSQPAQPPLRVVPG